MSIRITHHGHAPDEECIDGKCFSVDAIEGERVSLYKGRKVIIANGLDGPDDTDHLCRSNIPGHPDDPDGEHVCKVRLLAVNYRESGYPLTPLATILASLPRIPQTDLLYYCDGCGEYSSNTVTGHWSMADLDPASPVHEDSPQT